MLRRLLLYPLLLLLVLLVVADRVAAGYAEHRLAARIAASGRVEGSPQVSIHGFPLLTQALRGRYDGLRVAATTAASPHAHVVAEVDGVALPLRRLLAGGSDATAAAVDATATVSYAELARSLGLGARLAERGGSVVVTAAVPGVEVVARPVLAGQRLRLEPVSAAAGPLRLGLPDLEVRLPALPLGLRYTRVRVGRDGVALEAAGRDVRLSTSGDLTSPG